MADIYNPGTERLQPTASPNFGTERTRTDTASNVDKLLMSLGSDRTQATLDRFTQDSQASATQEQATKIEAYTEQFMSDHAGGAVSQAQVRQRFPETVPIIAARIAEAIGKRQGETAFASTIDTINNDDSLRLDTAARAAYVATARKDLFGTIPQGNDFYAAGVVQSMDKLLAQQELKWQGQTAQYHQDVQKEQLSKDVAEALLGNNAADVLSFIDGNYEDGSSLNRLERNKVIVKTAIDTAFTHGSLDVLTNVPDRYLNADSKADLEKARIQVRDVSMSKYKQAQYIEGQQREEVIRQGKAKALDAAVSGKPLDPAQFRDNPELFAYALSVQEAPRMPESVSVANAAVLTDKIFTDATSGAGGNISQVRDLVLARTDINVTEKKKILDGLGKTLEGAHLMSLPEVRGPMTDILGPRLTALENSLDEPIRQMMEGTNARSVVLRGYEKDIRRLWEAELKTTGSYPESHRQVELVDQAVDRATKQLEMLTKLGTSSSPPGKPPTAANNQATTRSVSGTVATPSASKGQSPMQAALAAELAKREKK